MGSSGLGSGAAGGFRALCGLERRAAGSWFRLVGNWVSSLLYSLSRWVKPRATFIEHPDRGARRTMGVGTLAWLVVGACSGASSPAAPSFSEAWYRETVMGEAASAADLYRRIYEDAGAALA